MTETEFLPQLSVAERADLFALGRRRSLGRGAYVITEGAGADGVHVLLAGHVKVFSTTEGGAEVVLAVRGPGALLGELGAIDNEPRGASVAAIEPIQLLTISVEAFTNFLTAHPALILMLMKTLTGRLRDADRKRMEFGAYDAVSRVSLRLVELADRFGERTPEGIRISLPFTQDELASWIGASREATVKALRTLRTKGHIQTQRKTVVVRDLDALRRRAGLA